MTKSRPIGFIAALGYEEMSAEAVVASLLASGFDGVEWTMAHVDDIRQPALALACQQDLVTGGEQALETTLAAIEKAAEAGVAIVDVLTGPNLWEPGAVTRSDEEAWSTALHGLEKACRRGEELGVTIGFEPCWGTIARDTAGAERVLESVPVSLTFDPSHFVMTGDDIPGFVRRWGDRIVHLHLKDAFGRPGREGEDFLFCLLGEGGVPWPELFDALDEVGFAGTMSVEFEAYTYFEQVLGSDPARAAVLAREQVDALLAGRNGVSR